MTGVALDATLAVALAAVVVTGIVRGFSGFGSGLILTPAFTLMYPTPVAVVTVVLMDVSALAYLLPGTWRSVDWRIVGWLTLGGLAGAPVGAHALAVLDPALMRDVVGGVALVSVLALGSGVRFHSRGRAPAVLGLGVLAGGLGGASGISAPPVVLYFLSGPFTPREVRANITAFYVFLVAALLGSFAWNGLVTSEVLVRSAVFIPIYVLAILAGSRLFASAPEVVFRRLAYTLVALVAIGAILR